jgi:uncharacterized membrane protein YdcZ (DUF606 family)
MEVFVFIIVFGAVCSMANVIIIEGKGYPKEDHRKWALIGGLLGIIGVVAAACQPEYKEK